MSAHRLYQVARPGGPRSGPLSWAAAMVQAHQISAATGSRALVFQAGEAHHCAEVPPCGLEPRDPWGGEL